MISSCDRATRIARWSDLSPRHGPAKRLPTCLGWRCSCVRLPHARVGLVLPLLATACIAAVGAALLLRPATALIAILALCGVAALFIFARAIPALFLGSLGVCPRSATPSSVAASRTLARRRCSSGRLMLGFGLVAAIASGSLLRWCGRR